VIRIFGDHDEKTVKQLERCVSAVEDSRGVLCADGHLGYSAPIGGVMAYREHVSPSGAGYDIGCGNKAVRTTLRADDLRPGLPRVMDAIVQNVSFGMGRQNDKPVDHPVLDAIRTADFAPQRKLYDLAAAQLGTVGAGNHYADLFEDEEGLVWVGVHFGSRGFGHKTASGFLALHEGKAFTDRGSGGEMESPPILFDVKTELGQAYVSAMALAGDYAYAGRDVVVDEIVRILGTEITDEVHNHHNYIWRETHGGEDWWVVRKGATPAFPGQRGFVGASMAEPAVILEGVETDVAAESLYSTVHGAGRAMSRNAAAGRPRKRWVNNLRDDATLYGSRDEALAAPGATKARSVRVREGGAIDFEAVRADLERKGIELRGGAADEAPGAYKRLDEVLRYHEGTVRILHTLKPLGVAMAGADTFDPYKD
jgi:tRNA-splicing ligase RtcB